jgi:hypothetical protein
MCVYVCVFAVACSTVTVTKCQAALRTLQAFPFFRPTCLCREPHVDPECNSFRDFLFDHPCIYVNKKGELVSEETRRDDAGESRESESDACRTLAPATGATLSSDKLHNMPPFVCILKVATQYARYLNQETRDSVKIPMLVSKKSKSKL